MFTHPEDFSLSAESIQQLFHESMVSLEEDVLADTNDLALESPPLMSPPPPAKRCRLAADAFGADTSSCLCFPRLTTQRFNIDTAEDSMPITTNVGSWSYAAHQPQTAGSRLEVHLIDPIVFSNDSAAQILPPVSSSLAAAPARVSPVTTLVGEEQQQRLSCVLRFSGQKRSHEGIQEPTTAPEIKQFRKHQADLWTLKYNELVEFYSREGHCNVPKAYGDASLTRWVKRQRYQMKRLQEGRESTLNGARISKLNEIGFVFDIQGAAWQARLSELKEFKAEFGHCNVPSNYPPNQSLAMWTKAQKRQYRLAKRGKGSFAESRYAELAKIGFEFELRKPRVAQRNETLF